jgi:hypothetical protein
LLFSTKKIKTREELALLLVQMLICVTSRRLSIKRTIRYVIFLYDLEFSTWNVLLRCKCHLNPYKFSNSSLFFVPPLYSDLSNHLKGGALVFQQSTVTISRLNATNNTAVKAFGAIEFNASNVTIKQFVVEGNSANISGGIGFNASNATLVDGRFDSNDSRESVSRTTKILVNSTIHLECISPSSPI